MGNESGTIRKLIIDGISFDCPADINITFNRSSFTIEGMPTTGDTIYKYQRRVPGMESVVIQAGPADAETLNEKAETLADKTFAVELADGSTYRTTGRFNYDTWETEENRHTVNIIPKRTKNAWTPVIV